MRNQAVEEAVDLLINLVDRLSAGEAVAAPAPSSLKGVFDTALALHGGSVRLASAFFVAYSLTDTSWDYASVPVGVRGGSGDKKLAAALTERHVTFHKSITAFGENLGWKGNVRKFDLSSDSRFASFLSALKQLSAAKRKLLLGHVAWVLHSSRVVPQALPALPGNYLSYARSLDLCEKLIAVPSEGHIQQFLVAAFLEVHRRRFSHRIVTHHPHASDKFDGTKGDIEEFRDYDLVAAYEVTVRNDWKNRLPDFGKKVSEGNLSKYVIFAAGVNADPLLSPAERLLSFAPKLPFDLAVVDLHDFFTVFCAELSRSELGEAFNRAHEILCEPRLSGQPDFIARYRAAMDSWIDLAD